MSKSLVFGTLTMLLLCLCSCTLSEGWGVPGPKKTGAVPSTGWFSGDDVSFSVAMKDGKNYVTYSRDNYNHLTFPVKNSGFYYQWGEISGTHCPTDAFCISGWFTSADTAEGFIRYGSGCGTTGDVMKWQASRSP